MGGDLDGVNLRISGDAGSRLRILGALLVLGAVLRLVYLLRMELPVFDPWRHLQLVDNLRAGLGFTLFDGQPYIWYSPAWYYLCAALPRSVGLAGFAGFLSLLCVLLVYSWVEAAEGGDRLVAAAAGAMMAAFGPLIAFTCHYGPEAFALALMLAALRLSVARPAMASAIASGLLFGIALCARMSFAFNAFLFYPVLRERRRAAALVAGMAVPLGLTWWRNHEVLSTYAYVFTWDGLATRSSEFNLLSTLVIQMHPAVQEGLRRLHEMIAPDPEWLRDANGMPAWGPMLFMACGIACLLLASRRLDLLLAGTSTLLYFLFADRSLSSNFFRIYLGLFPVFFAAVAHVGGRLGRWPRPGAALLPWGLVLLVVSSGAAFLKPPVMYPLEMVTAPPELLTEDAYMVNSSFYQPESLIYRYREKRFIGMPLYPEQFEDFRLHYPAYRSVLWHDFSVQDDLAHHLEESGAYRVARAGRNEHGRRYVVLVRAR